MLRRLFLIIKCGIACFLCAVCAFDIRASSSYPSYLCAKFCVLWPPLLSSPMENKCLANAKRPCDSSVLCLRPKSSLCSCPHCILDTTSFGSADSMDMHCASNNGVGQCKPIIQAEGNTFHQVFFGYFTADWLFYNCAAGSFHTTKLCSRLYSTKIEFWSEKLKNMFLSNPLQDSGVIYEFNLYLIRKSVVDFVFIIIEFFRYLLWLKRYKRKSVKVGVFRIGWVNLRLNFRLKGYFSCQYLWTVR